MPSPPRNGQCARNEDGRAGSRRRAEHRPKRKPADAKPAEPAAEPPADAKPAEPKTADTQEEAAKIAVEKENKRRQDEYDATVKAGQDKVKELNDRFADWYYIISDDVYKKIHLGRAGHHQGQGSRHQRHRQPEAARTRPGTRRRCRKGIRLA